MTMMYERHFKYPRKRKQFHWCKEWRQQAHGDMLYYRLERFIHGELLSISVAFSKYEQRIGIAMGLRRARWQMRQAIAEKFGGVV